MRTTIALTTMAISTGSALNNPPYGNPYIGCNPNELNLTVTGIEGAYCAPKCNVRYENGCNPQKIADVSAMPECMIGVNSTQNNYCALICNTESPKDQCDTAGGASCHHVSGVQGVCTYESKSTTINTKTYDSSNSNNNLNLFNPSQPVIDYNLIDTINDNPKATWVAEASPRFHQWTLGRTSNIANGAYHEDEATPSTRHILDTFTSDLSIPTHFDPRLDPTMTHCNATISHVRDQTDCGGCWAFSATEAFNDRRCLATNDTTLMSVQDTGACCSGRACMYSNGCVGGFIGAAWDWFISTGVVTGGDQSDINKTDTCEPFSLLVCTRNASHVTPMHPMCPKGEYKMPSCVSQCPNTGYPTPYLKDKKFANTSFKIKRYPFNIAQEELMTYGPISTIITVFTDFIHYKSGVYKHLGGSEIGSHAIEVIGWGVEQGEKYWLCKNSWGSKWGIQGFMKIAYGEVGIENSFTAGYIKGVVQK